jgi:hypothetical protein
MRNTMVTQPKPNIKHPWDRAAASVLTRTNGLTGTQEALDPGVNFFVLALEALGATPRFSCEGHPMGFYVAFEAPYELALEIHDAGYFSVEIWRRDLWTMRKVNDEIVTKPYTNNSKVKILRSAAEGWLRVFGDRLGSLSVGPDK